jgi:hypothetical protein
MRTTVDPLASAPRQHRHSRLIAALALAAALAGIAACGGSSATEPSAREAVFLVRSSAASGETFHILLRDPRLITEVAALVGRGNRKIVNGELRRGNGGFNQPWSWHLAPETVHLADATIELCDGRPSDVEGDIAYWVDVVGRFCPWGSEIVARVR